MVSDCCTEECNWFLLQFWRNEFLPPIGGLNLVKIYATVFYGSTGPVGLGLLLM